MSFEEEKRDISNNLLWKKIKSINELYSKYNFPTINCEPIKYEKRTSKSKFGSVSYVNGCSIYWGNGTFEYTSFLTGKIFEDMLQYRKILKQYLPLYEKYLEYKQKVDEIFDKYRLYKDISSAPQDNRGWFAKFFGTGTKERFEELSNYEISLLDKLVFAPQFPTVVLTLSAKTQYGSYEREKIYDLKSIKECYQLALEKKGKMTFIQQQRAIVSDDMRYNVMRRDGFRCCICGATVADGVKLEVDHIIPVSKGGKSTYDNLQTLCERCNRGKRDK